MLDGQLPECVVDDGIPVSLLDDCGVGQAHAKLILLGEHGVVYGTSALAIPVPHLSTCVTLKTKAGGVAVSTTSPLVDISFMAPDGVVEISEDFSHNIADLITATCQYGGKQCDDTLDVQIDSVIPLGRGLGSSAALARAVVVAVLDLYDFSLSADQIFDLVQSAEQRAHGRSSGIDAFTSGASGMVYFRQGQAATISSCMEGFWVITDSRESSKTADAIEYVRQVCAPRPLYRRVVMEAIDDLVRLGCQALAHGDYVGFGHQLNANHVLLADLGLTTPMIDMLADEALKAGACGSKVSGGGLGGCVVSLAPNRISAEAIMDAHSQVGAARLWCVPVEKVSCDDDVCNG